MFCQLVVRSTLVRTMAAFLLVLVCPLFASAGNYVFFTLDSPTGDPTQPFGINANRLVSATAEPTSLLDLGLIFRNGVGTTYLVPGSINTDFYQVNNPGQIAGDYYGNDGVYHAIVYNSANGTYTYLPDNASYLNNLAGGINNKGLVVGNFFPDATFTNGVGWFYNGSSYTIFSDPLATPGSEGTITYSVNDAGIVAGVYIDASGADHGFVYNGSTFTTIDPPGSVDTLLFGINNSNVVVGRYFDSAGLRHGFIDDNGQFTTIDFPGAVGTGLSGINDKGDLVGYYFDSNGFLHGFEADPTAPEPSTLGLLLTGIAGLLIYRRRRRLKESA
jgi:uncharacterized membrane protein